MRNFSKNQRLMFRVGFYLLIVAALYIFRGGVDWNRVGTLLRQGETEPEFSLAGRDLAPDLVDSLLLFYTRDYPDLKVALPPGGGDRALEDLLSGRSDLALQTTPPSARIQALAKAELGDTLDWQPIALAALELWSAAPEEGRLDVEGLRAALSGGDARLPGRLLAESPARGTWDAFAAALGLDPEKAAGSPWVVFLGDAASVGGALRSEPGVLALLAGLSMPAKAALSSARPVAVAPSRAEPAMLPEREAVAGGDYPLYYFLYICHREDATVEAAKFVTHLTSGRGQRQIERSGFLPARRILREIRLVRDSSQR